MKCQILFSGKNKGSISICHLLKILSRVQMQHHIHLDVCTKNKMKPFEVVFVFFPGILQVHLDGFSFFRVFFKCI